MNYKASRCGSKTAIHPKRMSSTSLNIDEIEVRREAALAFLHNRIDYERARNVPYSPQEFKLARMRELVARLGNPHERLAIVHIAGTKGKGSTAAMIAAILTASGYRTGAFTSPHLERLEERLSIDGTPCSPDELVELVDRVMPVAEQMDHTALAAGPPEIGPTYFELTTAMAMLHFAERGVDLAVFEVGLGGRLDSTNVCTPLVSVITSISFDHTRQLGNTLAAIAREKAGIIKPGVAVVSGVLEDEPREVIRRTCRERDCPLVELGTDFEFDYRLPRHLETGPALGGLDFRYRVSGRERGYRELPLALLGRHQAANAAVALAALEELKRQGRHIPEGAVRTGLARVTCPGRVEVISRRPAIILDVAHNAASVDALIEVLDGCFSARRRFLVFAATHEKDLRGMLERLLGRFDEVIFTRYLNNPRAVPPEDLAALAAQLGAHPTRIFPDPAGAWDAVRQRVEPEDLVCVTGSFFLAGEIREQIGARPLAAGEALAETPT